MSLENYEPVSERIKRFYADHPNGAIHTELVYDDGDRVVMKASVYRDITDAQPSGTDYAEEIKTDRGVNATSRIENCATSAQGRCLAAIGYLGSDWTTKPSREEMAKVERRQTGPTGGMAGGATPAQLGKIRALAKSLGQTPPVGYEQYSKEVASRTIEAMIKQSQQADNSDEEPF